MKISQITDAFICTFIREDATDADVISTLSVIKPAALAYLTEHTGLTATELDDLEDVTYVYLAAVEQMYDTRKLTVDETQLGYLAATILSLHSKNNVG